MPQYMLDTDISSYIMKRSSVPVLTRLAKTSRGDVCVSVITKGELLFGVQTHPMQQVAQASLDSYLRNVMVLDLPSHAAVEYAKLRADLKFRGCPIGSNDMLIAAHALHMKLILVTNNTREFERVKGLKIENWTK